MGDVAPPQEPPIQSPSLPTTFNGGDEGSTSRCCLLPIVTTTSPPPPLLPLLPTQLPPKLLILVNHSSLTPRQRAKFNEPNSHLANVRNVVQFNAECDVSDCTIRLTISCGRPGGNSPSRFGRDRHIVCT